MDGTLVGEQLLHAPCWISNTAVLSSSACLLITPPPHLNQQFLTHDNNVVLSTANSLENTTARFSISVANFHDYHASKFRGVAYTQSTVEGPQYSTSSLASNLNDTTFSRYNVTSLYLQVCWYTVSYNSVQVRGTNSEGNKVSKLLCNLCVLWTVADGTLVGEQLLHAPCWISNTAVLSSSACLIITPPPRLIQQFSTHDNSVVLATANSLENITARFSISVAIFHDYHASKFCSVAYTQSTVEWPQYSTPSLASNLNDTTFSRYKYTLNSY